MSKSKKYKKVFTRIIHFYIQEEKELKNSETKLGDDAYDLLMKRTKGRVIDSFLTAKTVNIELDKLIKTHRGTFYSIEDMLWKMDDHEPIFVIKHKKKYLVMDGHHRLLIHRILGKAKINAKLIDLDKKVIKKRSKKK
jgi:hypothetical protein